MGRGGPGFCSYDEGDAAIVQVEKRPPPPLRFNPTVAFPRVLLLLARMKTSDPLRRRAGRIVRLLAKQYPDAHCALRHDNPLQLLVATILSAQCTDVRVNLVTPALFARFPDAVAFAVVEQAELEKAIQSTGFFRNKA